MNRLEKSQPEIRADAGAIRAREFSESTERRHSINVTAATFGGLWTLAQHEREPLWLILLSCWAAFVSRWTGQEVVRLDVELGDCNRVSDQQRGSSPTCRVELRAGLEDDPTVVEVQRQFEMSLRDSGVPVEEIRSTTRVTARHPQTALGLSLSIDVSGAVNARIGAVDVDQEVVSRMTGSFSVLLLAAASDARQPVSRLRLMTESERETVLYRFNATAAPLSDCLIHELVEEQVRHRPRATAVVFKDQSITFSDLNTRANKLARALRQRGICPNELVAVCVDRGIDMVVSLLAVLKAGGAYVPLDPTYPRERLAYMLEDARPKILLTQTHLQSATWVTARNVINIDEDWGWISELDCSNLKKDSQSSPHQLAYVIYTSGSTGAPKGALNEHRGMVNRILAQQSIERFSDGDICAQTTSISFVDAVFEIFGPLSFGKPLVIVPAAVVRDIEKLGKLIAQERVTRLVSVPSLARLILDSPGVISKLSTLRSWTLSGEEVRGDLLRALQAKLTDCEFIIQYGSSEVSSDAAIYKSRHFSERRVPLGPPLQNVQLYVLDRHGEPVPVGVTGEIYVGGVGVGRGYRNRPDLTAHRFLSDRFAGHAHGRLYRTGDLGRWRADGMLEYQGRGDYQVKIRGFRVELGEVEAQLQRHEKVRQAVVVARDDPPGDRRLVAYLTLTSDQPVETTEKSSNSSNRELVRAIRAHMKARLPDYMVPAAFVVLDSFPLTPNGKLDRHALPAPGIESLVTSEYESPLGETEQLVAEVWKQLLGVEKIGRGDSFVEMGGHSLLIAQMLERLRGMGLLAELRHIFEAPTLAEFAAIVVRASDTEAVRAPDSAIPRDCRDLKPEMFPQVVLEQAHIDRITSAVPGGVENIQDAYPLTPLQEGILFHHQLSESDGDAYILGTLLHVESRSRLDELISALQEVINRHDVLRSAILWDGLPQPVQVVYRRATLHVREVSLDPKRDARVQVRSWPDSNKLKLDLRHAPLVELLIAKDSASAQWYAWLLIHHIALDAASLRDVISETVALLNGDRELPAPAPYRDYVAEVVGSAGTTDAERYFREELSDVDEPTAPFGVLEVHGESRDIREATLACAPELSKRIRQQARRHNVTTATLFHSAWSLVVARTTGRDDVLFGTVLAAGAKDRVDGRRGLGLFINMLPIRVDLENASAIDLVSRAQRKLIELMTYSQTSLANAQRCSGVVGGPLFTSVLNYRHGAVDFEAEWSRAPGIQMLEYQDRTNYPITLSVDDLASGFMVTAQTLPAINASSMAEYMLEALSSLVSALESSPDAPALRLQVLPAREMECAIRRLNETRMPVDLDKSVSLLFEEQVERTPHAIAVEYSGRSLSYSELNFRANQLARYLRSRGVGVGQLVGVCVNRSIEMIVGALGALKAGAAYLPLDPNYPAERLKYMIEDATPRVVLNEGDPVKLGDCKSSLVLGISEALADARDCSGDDLTPDESGVTPLDLVYVIYTSGSTGRPKGTMMTHRSMVNLIEWHRANFSTGHRVLQFAALSFDVAFQEIFSTLCTGSTLLLLDEWTRRDPRELSEFIQHNAVDRLFLPPLMLQGLAEAFRTTGIAPRGLKDIITAGEQLRISPEIVALVEQLPSCRLHNHYGPTETHVVTTLTLEGSARDWPRFPSIGKPLWNTSIYLLDKLRQPVPVGVPGEIYVGGAAVARGYLRRPDMTAQRFVPDPFSDEPEARMYCTGDLGRWRTDGTIEYLGRHDAQVKIRGYRVELGEIEVLLSRHEGVRQAAVIAQENLNGGRRLVAYVTERDGAALAADQLRAHVAAALPEYMIPSCFVVLQRMPMTPSGKLDRRVLPAPDQADYLSRHYEPPRGELEQALASIWGRLLDVQRVGRNDNFFELGGHSLMAMKLGAMLAETCRIHLPVSAVFRYPVLWRLAEALQSTQLPVTPSQSFRPGEFEEGVL